ncbi:hypothetical protein Ocin01_06853 [Orchesella cincta]|uniref:F-box domain-containing protein n=1 Tax=Orchesella cincta TaxID=48709 RepID=A0A1D2N3J2_ORCCI|nr:hypothetical protein Ocin01_06853 [Orchesella cincta]
MKIISNVLGYLSYEDLKCSRLVCRTWEEESSTYLKDKFQIMINSEEKLRLFTEEFFHNRTFSHSVQIGPYMYLGNPSAESYFNYFGYFIKKLVLLKTQCSAFHLREILFRQAPNIEELTLHGMTPGKCRFYENLHVYDKDELPNLKVLNINLMSTQGEHMLHHFLYDLFSVTPNLQKISVPSPQYKGFLKTLIAVLLESTEVPFKYLKHVDALFSFGDGHLELLKNRKLPLESLNLQLMPNVTIDLLIPLLESLSGSLKKLRLYFYLTRFKELPSQLKLDNLQHLTLDTYQGSLRFTTNLPQLKSLTVTMKCNEELEEAFQSDPVNGELWTCESLKSFTAVFSVVESCPPHLVSKLAKCFPSLTSIDLQGLTDSSLRVIFISFPKLEELSAPQGFYSDSGITGNASNRFAFNLSIPYDFLKNVELESRLYPSILYTPNLRKLKLYSPDVTDASIYFGVVLCKELKELSIERSDITDYGIDAIIRFMDLYHLSITQCTRVSGPQLELVKEKMKYRNLSLDFSSRRAGMYD